MQLEAARRYVTFIFFKTVGKIQKTSENLKSDKNEDVKTFLHVQCESKSSLPIAKSFRGGYFFDSHCMGKNVDAETFLFQGSTCHLLKMLLHELVLDQLQLMNQRIQTSLFVLNSRRRPDHRPDTLHDVIAAHVTPLHFRFRTLVVAVSASGHTVVRVSVDFLITADDARLGLGSEIGR